MVRETRFGVESGAAHRSDVSSTMEAFASREPNRHVNGASRSSKRPATSTEVCAYPKSGVNESTLTEDRTSYRNAGLSKPSDESTLRSYAPSKSGGCTHLRPPATTSAADSMPEKEQRAFESVANLEPCMVTTWPPLIVPVGGSAFNRDACGLTAYDDVWTTSRPSSRRRRLQI